MPRRIVIPDPGERQYAFWTAKERKPRPQCFVYVLQAEGDTPIKIGKAKDVHHRMAVLQTGNPRPLRLRAVLVGDLELEAELHRELRGRRMVGEWFDYMRVPLSPYKEETEDDNTILDFPCSRRQSRRRNDDRLPGRGTAAVLQGVLALQGAA